MRKPLRAGWLAVIACITTATGCRSPEPPDSGTGGAGSPGEEGVPLGEDRMMMDGEELVLEIAEVSVQGGDAELSRTSFVTDERITLRGRVRNGEEQEERIRWEVLPVGEHTGPATPATHQGRELTFQANSQVGTSGSRQPNPPLEYEVIATLLVEDEMLRVRLPPSAFVRQDEPDVLRQEYLEFGTRFQPEREHVSMPARATLNTGNYSIIAEEDAGELSRLLDRMSERANALLNNDVQEQRVGTRGLDPTTVVVSPGAPILTAGPLGDTDPQGDDVCAGPLVEGRCAGPVLAGPNGRAETRANNRDTRVNLEPFVSSAFRNPQRNRAIGSVALNSRHTRGRALDLDPRMLKVPGKTPQQMMCIVEAAGDDLVGERNSFTERGAALFLACDSPSADHVHVQR